MKRKPGVAYGRIQQEVPGGSVLADQAPPAAPEGTPLPQITQEKACQIIAEGEVNGQPLTAKQAELFNAICNGEAPIDGAEKGTVVKSRRIAHGMLDVVHDTPYVK